MPEPSTTTHAQPGGYALDPAWHAERTRLNSLTGLYDAGTLRLCEQLGLAEGWRCLDVGAGTGTVAELLAQRVGPAGSVTALDVDTRFLDPLGGGNIQVSRVDVTAEPLPTGHFDLVHARLLLEHLPQRDDVLRALAGALCPGGWLLVQDFDWVTATAIDPPAAVHDRVVEACLTFLTGRGYDPHFARTLPRRLATAGLTDVTTHAVATPVQADRRDGVPQWELLVDQLAPALLATRLVTQADLDAFHDLWHDGTTVCFAPLMISTWGRRRADGAQP
jgi:SAM-dependent methyltransferase